MSSFDYYDCFNTGNRFRAIIEYRAKILNCLKEIRNLTDLEAIRFIQIREGNSSCFGREVPLKPSGDSKECTAFCCWRETCNFYRNEVIIPLDRDFGVKDKDELETFKKKIREYNEQSFADLRSNEIGLKFSNYYNVHNALKKMLVMSPKTVISEYKNGYNNLKCYSFDVKTTLCGQERGCEHVTFDTDVLLTSNIRELNKMLNETEQFINDGNLAYYPLLTRINHKTTRAYGSFCWSFPEDIEVNMFDAPHIGLIDKSIMLSDPAFVPLINIDIPFIENSNYNSIYQVMSEHPDELGAFRDFLYPKIEEIRELVIGSYEFGSNCKRIKREIDEGLRKLNSDYTKNKIKNDIFINGGFVVSFPLLIYCFHKSPDGILYLFGANGVYFKLGELLSDYLINNIGLKDSPVYFLWTLGDTQRKF